MCVCAHACVCVCVCVCVCERERAARDVAGQGGRGQIMTALEATLRNVDFVLRVVKIHWNVLSKRVTQSDMVVVSFSRSVW